MHRITQQQDEMDVDRWNNEIYLQLQISIKVYIAAVETLRKTIIPACVQDVSNK